jgi:hypothetical protein
MIASRIVFIPKSDGSSRPLGIGEAWLRLFGRILNQKFAARLAIQLSPIQLCVGISGGCKIAARLSDIYMSRSDYLGCPGFLKIDASNAFNEIRRGIIYDNLRELCPELCAVFHKLYGQHCEAYNSKLLFLKVIKSRVKELLQTTSKIIILGDFSIFPEDKDCFNPYSRYWIDKP